MIETINEQQRAMMHKILDVVIDQNNKGNNSFFDYSGHTNMIEIEILNGSWVDEKKGKNVKNKVIYEDLFYATDKYSSSKTTEQIYNEISKL